MKRLACALALACVGSLAAMPMASEAAPLRPQSGLQLSILTPDPGSVSDRITVDVSYRGGAVDTVELYVDGNLVVRRSITAMQTRGVISFTMDSLELSEGDHKVQVKASGVDGKAVVTNGKLHIAAPDVTAALRINYPLTGTSVNGVVPIKVQLDSDLQKQKPYVTFFVDKELKVLKNFAPYEYNWDTTQTVNGWHTVEAWGQTAEMAKPLKARSVRVRVENSTGETKATDRVEDLRLSNKVTPSVTIPIDKPKTANNKPAFQVDPGTAQIGTPPFGPRIEFALNSPAAPVIKPLGPSARQMGGAIQQPQGRMAFQASKAVLPGISDAGSVNILVPPAQVGQVISVRPGSSLRVIARQTGVPVKDLARLNNMPNSGRSRIHGKSVIIPQNGAFDIAFNGTKIAFDVQPRIENGVKLAPFRQIFEHTGGRLYWFGDAKTVRAVNSSREIEIKVGSNSALVNNEIMNLDHPAYIASGRTIVPLTFVRDSMNVKIDFDPKSGRLLIQSK